VPGARRASCCNGFGVSNFYSLRGFPVIGPAVTWQLKFPPLSSADHNNLISLQSSLNDVEQGPDAMFSIRPSPVFHLPKLQNRVMPFLLPSPLVISLAFTKYLP
jgi:hypothetical protein